MARIVPIKMPKWGLSMEEGTVIEWLKPEGAAVNDGDELLEIETAKIANVFESPSSGVLRRIIARPGDRVPVGSLVGVLAAGDVSEAEIEQYLESFVNSSEDEGGTNVAPALHVSAVTAVGSTLQYGRAGPETGVPVVLVHGWAADLKSWLFNIEAIAAHHPVYAIDLPGHGGSSKDVRDGSTESLASFLGAAIDALGLPKVHLVGHSLGASAAAKLAADRPELVETITLIAPAHLPNSTMSGDFFEGVINSRNARSLKPFLQMLVAEPSSITREMIDDVLKYKRIDGVEHALRMTRDRLLDGVDGRAMEDALPLLGGRSSGVLIISSKTDQIVGPPDEHSLPPGIRLQWIEGAGHLPHLEQAAEVNAALLKRFLFS